MSATDFGRLLVEILEIDLDLCSRTYGVAPCTGALAAGNECYNSYTTCQDRANYAKSTKTYRFITRGAPLPSGVASCYPYITGINTVPTVVDPEQGLARRSNVTVTLLDAPDGDAEQDPYLANRASAAGGTFLRRLFARNLNYAGRYARIKRLYTTTGNYAITDPGFVTELYVIDAVNGPGKDGRVTLTLSDPLKLADRSMYPAATDCALAASMTATDLSATLATGKGANLGASGYICIDNEIINFTSRVSDVISWPSTAYREQFNSTAATHNSGAKVQLCATWSAATIRTVCEDILNAAGVADGYIDLTGMQGEVDTWLGPYAVTSCVAAPRKASDLLKEVCTITQSVMWWDVVTQKVKFQCVRPLQPGSTPSTLDDAGGFISGSIDVARKDADRITRVAVFYNPIDYTKDGTEPSNYQSGYILIDTDAESANEYNDVRAKTFYTRLVNSDAAASEFATRYLAAHRDAPIVVKAMVDPKETGIAVAAQVDITTARLTDYHGQALTARALCIRRNDRGEDVECEFLATWFDRRWFWIAPDSHPDYTAATDAERVYGYISDNNGILPDGTKGHLII